MTQKPPQQQSERKEFLSQVEKTLRSGKSSAILGGKKFGKTFLARDIERRLSSDFLAVSIDLERIALTPETFSIEFIGKVIAQSRAGKEDPSKFREIPYLLLLEKEMGEHAFSILQSVNNELQKIKPDQRLLVGNAFLFCSAFSTHLKKKPLIIWDNAEHLFDLNNFPAIGDIFSLLLSQGKITSLFTSAAISEMRKLERISHFAMPPLNENEIEALVKTRTQKADKKTIQDILRLSKGHPSIAQILAKRVGEGLSPPRAYAQEMLAKEGSLFRYGDDAFTYYYSRARGQTLIKLLLRTIALHELRLSDIARKIFRSAPVTKSLLERLIAVDAIEKRGKIFAIADPHLKAWLRMIAKEIDVDDISQVDEKRAEEVTRDQ